MAFVEVVADITPPITNLSSVGELPVVIKAERVPLTHPLISVTESAQANFAGYVVFTEGDELDILAKKVEVAPGLILTEY